MKIDRSNFSLVLMSDVNGDYEGTLNVIYKEKIFNKEIQIDDFASIREDERPLRDNEKTLINQINKLITKELSKRGFKFDKWSLLHRPDAGEFKVEYMFGETLNALSFSLSEDTTLVKKALSLGRSVSKRLLKELK